MAVDTLKLYERFSKAGIPDAGAKEIAEAIRETDLAITTELASKKDLELVKKDLELAIENLRNELIKWMIGIAVAGFTGLLGGVLGLLKILKAI